MKTTSSKTEKRKPAGRTRALAVDAGWASVSSRPKVSSAKLHSENRVYIHPVAALGKDRYECQNGWTLLGWANAPWKSAIGPHAIVYEKVVAKGADDGDMHDHFEPGLYWGHGDAEKMLFGGTLADVEAEELEPWLSRPNISQSGTAESRSL